LGRILTAQEKLNMQFFKKIIIKSLLPELNLKASGDYKIDSI
jgi:hypothetical protein